MRYIIAGKSDSFWIYLKKNKYKLGTDAVHARTLKIFNKLTKDDSIVLLYGWWMRSWAKDALFTIMSIYPFIRFEYLDGPFGEKERNNLQSDKIFNRFELIDIPKN